MSEREQKLEAALRKVIDAYAEYLVPRTDVCDLDAFCDTVTDVVTQRELCEALATPPTREWNEAIEAAALFCEDVASALDVHGHFPDTAQKEITDIANSIRVLKRKERA